MTYPDLHYPSRSALPIRICVTYPRAWRWRETHSPARTPSAHLWWDPWARRGPEAPETVVIG